MYDPAAGLTGTGANVDDPVGGLHRLLVVLDNDERVAQVPQALKGGNELAIVALMQADRRLVKDVEDTDEAGADLRGQADTLRLATRKSARTARQRQVGEPNVNEKRETSLDLGEDRRGDRACALLELDVREERARVRDRHVGELGDRLIADAHGQHLRAQAGTVARRARDLAHVGVELFGHCRGLGFLALALNILDRSFEARRVGALAPPSVTELDRDLVVLAVQHGVLDLLRQRFPGCAHREAQLLGEGFEELLVVLEVGVPDNDGTVGEGKLLVGNDQLGVDLEAEA